jgi:hypothetical protein
MRGPDRSEVTFFELSSIRFGLNGAGSRQKHFYEMRKIRPTDRFRDSTQIPDHAGTCPNHPTQREQKHQPYQYAMSILIL